MILFLMHIKYKIHCSDQDEGEKVILQHFSSHAMKSKVLLNPPFPFMYCLYFLFRDTFMVQAFTEPSPFSLLWSQRRQIPLTHHCYSLLCFALCLPQLSDVPCSLFLSSHLFFLSAEKGKEMWIYVVLGTWTPSVQGSRAASPISLLEGTFLGACIIFPGMWTGIT